MPRVRHAVLAKQPRASAGDAMAAETRPHEFLAHALVHDRAARRALSRDGGQPASRMVFVDSSDHDRCRGISLAVERRLRRRPGASVPLRANFLAHVRDRECGLWRDSDSRDLPVRRKFAARMGTSGVWPCAWLADTSRHNTLDRRARFYRLDRSGRGCLVAFDSVVHRDPDYFFGGEPVCRAHAWGSVGMDGDFRQSVRITSVARLGVRGGGCACRANRALRPPLLQVCELT